MQFPQIIRDLEQRKKSTKTGTIMTAITYDKNSNEYVLYTNDKVKDDPFVKSMLMRIKEHIHKNYNE